jgi:hypothetical protein
MIVCEKYNFIFIRIPKNASTSLAAFFINNCCGKNDIYTGVGNAKIKPHNINNNIIEKYSKDMRYIHLTLNELIENEIITKRDAENKKVIGVIRNPLERQLSLFFFLHRKDKNTSPETFRKEFENGHHESDLSNLIPQTDYLKIGDEPVGEFWLYENLNNHLTEFINEHNIKINKKLENYKSQFKRKDKNLIEQYYDKHTKKAVEDYYKSDFALYREMLDENR